jgi:hypothetical protein
MLRRIIAGTAVAGALTLGVAGVAGAATPSSGTSKNTPSAQVCSRLPKIEARVQTYEAKVNARIPKAEAREAKARAAGHTKLANYIAARITRVQNRESRLNNRLSTIEAKCGTTSSTGTGTTAS